MTFKDFLKKESVFGNIMPGVYTHSGYDDPIKKALRQAPGYLVKVNASDKLKINNKKRFKKIKKIKIFPKPEA